MYGMMVPVPPRLYRPYQQGDTVFTATAAHVYPPADECSYTAEAYVVYDGAQCVSSSRQEQTFSAWARDNQNGAVIITDPVVAQFCEGEDIVDVRVQGQFHL